MLEMNRSCWNVLTRALEGIPVDLCLVLSLILSSVVMVCVCVCVFSVSSCMCMHPFV